MDYKSLITELYAGIKKRPEVKAVIPMGYVPGYPVLTIRNEQLIVAVPFLRYKQTGEIDRTIVFPIRYVMEFVVPELTLVCFRDLSVEEAFADTDFDKGTGFFRHDAVKDLDRNGYAALRARVLAGVDIIVKSLVEDTVCDASKENAFKNDLQRAVEPSLLGYYKALDGDFYSKYLKK